MAKVSRKVLREEVKAEYVKALTEILLEKGEEVLRVGSNKLALPIVDREGNEDFVTITISIPTGSTKDNEPYDGYGEAESYAMKVKDNEEKARKKAEKKAEKIKRDEEYRRKKAEQKAEQKAREEGK